jgi:hypothetical protein
MLFKDVGLTERQNFEQARLTNLPWNLPDVEIKQVIRELQSARRIMMPGVRHLTL